MFESSIKRRFGEWRRQRKLIRIRRLFAGCGYPLDHLDDSGVVNAVTRGGECRLKDVPLTAKMIYFTLRRLSMANGEKSGENPRE